MSKDSKQITLDYYCPHLYLKKNRKERMMNIPYTSRPMKIDLTGNVHPKLLNLSISNINTVAYQNYTIKRVIPIQDEMNFTRHFYLQNLPDDFKACNTVLEDQEEQIYQNSAYSLAADATKQYDIFSQKRQQHLKNARARARTNFNKYFQTKKQDILKLKQEQKKWVIDYFRKVEELIDHIFNKKKKQDKDPNIQDKLFLKSQAGKDAKYIKGTKISDPKKALQILVALRAILLQKKVSLQSQRKDQDHKKQVTNSYMDTSNASQSQNLSQVSMISATTQGTKQQKEQHYAQQFCDFPALEKKWKKKDVEEIRFIIRRLLSFNLVNKAEGHEMRQKKRAKEKNQYLRKQMQLLSSSSKKVQQNPKTQKGKDKSKILNKTTIPQKSSQKSGEIQLVIPISQSSLNKQQLKVKQNLLKGGQFDSIGDIYERNRNYSTLFKSRQKDARFELSFRQDYQRKVPFSSRV